MSSNGAAARFKSAAAKNANNDAGNNNAQTGDAKK